MTDRIFSQAELEEVAGGLLPKALIDRRSLLFCTEIQVRPLTRSPEGRSAIAQRLDRIEASRRSRGGG